MRDLPWTPSQAILCHPCPTLPRQFPLGPGKTSHPSPTPPAQPWAKPPATSLGLTWVRLMPNPAPLMSSIPETVRILGSLLVILLLFALTAALVKVDMTPGPFFSITMASVWFINCEDHCPYPPPHPVPPGTSAQPPFCN